MYTTVFADADYGSLVKAAFGDVPQHIEEPTLLQSVTEWERLGVPKESILVRGPRIMQNCFNGNYFSLAEKLTGECRSLDRSCKHPLVVGTYFQMYEKIAEVVTPSTVVDSIETAQDAVRPKQNFMNWFTGRDKTTPLTGPMVAQYLLLLPDILSAVENSRVRFLHNCTQQLGQVSEFGENTVDVYRNKLHFVSKTRPKSLEHFLNYTNEWIAKGNVNLEHAIKTY